MNITMNRIDFKRVRHHFHAPRNNCRESLCTVWYTSTRIDWTLCSSIVVHLNGMIFVSIIHVLFLPLSCCMQYHVLISGANLEPFCVRCKHMHIWNSSITITSLVILFCVHNEPDVHAKMTHIKSLSEKITGCKFLDLTSSNKDVIVNVLYLLMQVHYMIKHAIHKSWYCP